MNRVSIIMPAYNAQDTLMAALDSVQAQTHLDWQLLLIVDRNSKDATREIAQSAASREDRIRVITDLDHGGCVYNRNEGLRLAETDLIAFLDSDDVWHPEKLERQLCLMQETGSVFSCTGYGWMKFDGTPLPTVVTPPAVITHEKLLRQNHIGCLTVLLRKSGLPEIKFVEFLHEDYILWLQLLKHTPAHGLPENLATYRLARNSRSGNKLHAATQRWRILRRFERLSLLRSCVYFSHYGLSALRKRSSRL